MSDRDDDKELRQTFLSEVAERAEALSQSLLLLRDRAPAGAVEPEDVNDLFRHVHTLKGIAAMFEESDLVAVAHGMEDVLEDLRLAPVLMSQDTVDVLLEGSDLIAEIGDRARLNETRELPISSFLERLKRLSFAPAANADTQGDYEPEVNATSIGTVRVDPKTIDRIASLSKDLLSQQGRLFAMSMQLPEAAQTLVDSLSVSLHALDAEAQSLLRVPLSQIFAPLGRATRTFAREAQKRVRFIAEGGELEVDRARGEKLLEPLLHLLRNAIDHGIELSEVRAALGKSEEGTLHVRAMRRDGALVIAVRDDGAGIDVERVVDEAIRCGVVTEENARELSTEDAWMLVFEMGVSTAPAAATTSGRGTGLAIVKAAISELDGRIALTSERGQGTTWALTLQNFSAN
ncbi:MAG: Hpt domain-containing protein [Sandaracinaceae bacterium]|jgi:two-component system chemotaxis sensor kinase CheA|nr:Hpt domain-containing protein [Sandaracinaceae bacterium]